MSEDRILNPYSDREGKWVKGNLHTHSDHSHCGKVKLEEIYNLYKDFNYDFIAITDHDLITEVSNIDDDFLIIKGYEASKNSHILCIGSDHVIKGSYQEIIKNVDNKKGVSILCHPNWKSWEYWSVEDMEKLECYTGIEIYNSVINRLVGSCEAFTEWDYLLSHGKKVWGFANDDFHVLEDVNKAWNVVRVEQFNERNIIDSIRKGNFYTSTGVQIFDIYLKNNKLVIDTDADKLRFISGGRTLSIVLSSKAVFDINDFGGYIRVEAINEDGSRAWSQPIFKI